MGEKLVGCAGGRSLRDKHGAQKNKKSENYNTTSENNPLDNTQLRSGDIQVGES